MEEDKQNANPTILNPSDLPTRKAKDTATPRKDGGIGLFDSLLLSPSKFSDPFSSDSASTSSDSQEDEEIEAIDAQEIYDLISPISDPEHPISLGSLNVVQLQDIHVHPPKTPESSISTVLVEITPTITHCSLATVIGLGVRVRLEQALPPRFRVDVRVKKGTHSSDVATSKQLGDKERVAAAIENQTLMGVIDRMLATCT